MEDIFTSLKPVYYFSKVSGLFLYKPVGTAGNRRFVVHKIAFIYCLVDIMIYLAMEPIRTPANNSQEIVLIVISTLQTITNAVQLVTNVVCNIYYSTTQVTLLNALDAFDKRANRFGIFINYKQTFRHLFVRVVAEILMWFLFLCLSSRKDMSIHIRILLGLQYFAQKLLKSSVVIHFEAWIMLLNERFKALCQNLLDVISSVNISRCDKKYLNHIVAETSYMHLTLSAIAEKVNNIYSIQLLMSVTMQFVLLLVMAYDMCCRIYLHDIMNLHFINSIYWLFYTAMNMSITCVLCARLIKNANCMKTILHEISICTMDDNLIRQVSLLSVQLFHGDFQINAGRFFNIDLSLVYAMVGAVTTYLVIALQFFVTLHNSRKSNYNDIYLNDTFDLQ